MIRTRVAAAVLTAPQLDQSDWARLDQFEAMAGRNAQATYEEMEWE